MTWCDYSAILFLIICGAVGARLGSLWIGVCLLGGFFGSCLADTYVYSLSEYLGNFSGAFPLAWILLFLGGLAVVLLPGFLLSRIGVAVLAGVIDSGFGLFAGLFTGVILLALLIFLVLPLYPKLERASFWKGSKVVRPVYGAIEGYFDRNFLNGKKIRLDLKKEFDNSVKGLKSFGEGAESRFSRH